MYEVFPYSYQVYRYRCFLLACGRRELDGIKVAWEDEEGVVCNGHKY